MKEEWRFKISSELKNILGRDLITDSNIAILELVKNSFDAHATQVEIKFDNNELMISDNGKGMSEKDILDKWLFVAYSAKKDGSEDSSYRDGIKRKYAGAKGIGRLSCDRLGSYLNIITKTEKCPDILKISIDWDQFEINSKKEFSEIPVKHNRLNSFPFFEHNSSGTIIKISRLRDEWTRDEILKLKRSLEKLINPFGENDEFKIIFTAPSEVANDEKKLEESRIRRKNWDTLSITKQTEIIDLERSIINGPVVNTIAQTLNLKTTRIDSIIKDGIIQTTLYDRGSKIYEISEEGKFHLLENATITLFYLNKAAKYNFSKIMGLPSVKYGSVFLFRNNFRLMPYGEYKDDSWGIDQRYQQGYSRYLSTRSIIGRVDVETDNLNEFKEVSSRDGGLINSPEKQQLMDFFFLTFKRLERYVVGVLWGEGFLRHSYFANNSVAQELREKLQGKEKESETIEHLLDNIGSKVDFLNLVKSLVDDSNINLIYYNEDLANIVNNISETDIIQNKFINDLRRVATNTNDLNLLNQLSDFERKWNELLKQKESAEKNAKIEKEKAKAAAKKARIEKEKRELETSKRKEVEKERDAQIQKNKYLSSTRDTSKEVEDIMHAVMISSTELSSIIDIQKELLDTKPLNIEELALTIKDARINIERINLLSSLITRADTKLLRDSFDIDIISYCKEFMTVFQRKYDCIFENQGYETIIKKLTLLNLSLVLLNIVSNAGKNGASKLKFIFSKEGNLAKIQISDNGMGVDLDRFTPDSIFEVGVTNREGGAGIGLSTVKSIMEDYLQGSVEFIGNGLNNMRGATFQLTFN